MIDFLQFYKHLGSILGIGGMGAFFLAPSKQMSLLTISDENIFFHFFKW